MRSFVASITVALGFLAAAPIRALEPWDTRVVVRSRVALDALRYECRLARARSPTLPSWSALWGPRSGLASDHPDLCERSRSSRRPVGARGGTVNAYDRWVNDRVRELPSPAETAGGATGGP